MNREIICIVCFEEKEEGILVEECPYDFEGLYNCYICGDCIERLYKEWKVGR